MTEPTPALSPSDSAARSRDPIEEVRRIEAPLSVKLRRVLDATRAQSPVFADTMDSLVARLADNGVGLNAPGPGEPMPPFLLPDEGGRLVGLPRLLEDGPVVVSFNRGHWCPYCRLNMDALARAEAEIASLGAQIVAISPETAVWSAKLKADSRARFRILADIDCGYALEMNLLFWVGDEARSAMSGAGVDLVRFQDNDAWMLPIPATFVVGADGVILSRHVDPDFRRRMEVEDLLGALRAARPRDQAR